MVPSHQLGAVQGDPAVCSLKVTVGPSYSSWGLLANDAPPPAAGEGPYLAKSPSHRAGDKFTLPDCGHPILSFNLLDLCRAWGAGGGAGTSPEEGRNEGSEKVRWEHGVPEGSRRRSSEAGTAAWHYTSFQHPALCVLTGMREDLAHASPAQIQNQWVEGTCHFVSAKTAPPLIEVPMNGRS